MPEYVYSIILIIVIIVVVMLWSNKKKNDEWEGDLVKKKLNRGDMETRDSYLLVFKTNEGNKKRFNTPSEEFWNEWEVGDRARKVKGEFFPEKI